MAGSFHTANMLAEYSLNLLRGQMVSQLMTGHALAGMKGMSLTEFILGKPKETERRSGTNRMDNALNGLMRSDAAMLRQASTKMLQGKALLQTGGDSIILIQEKIKRMKEIVEKLKAGDPAASALKAEYAALAAEIKSIIENSQFNEISLLDGEKWADDERITQNGDTGKIQLQSGYAPNELTLYDLSSHKTVFAAHDLNTDAGLDATALYLGTFGTTLEGMAASYNARAGLLDSESVSLQRRADILDEATERAKPGDEESLKQTLIDILMRDGGSILSGAS